MTLSREKFSELYSNPGRASDAGGHRDELGARGEDFFWNLGEVDLSVDEVAARCLRKQDLFGDPGEELAEELSANEASVSITDHGDHRLPLTALLVLDLGRRDSVR